MSKRVNPENRQSHFTDMLDMTDPYNKLVFEFISLQTKLYLAVNYKNIIRGTAPMKEAKNIHQKYLGEKANFQTYRQAYEWVTMICEDNGFPARRPSRMMLEDRSKF